MTALLSRFWHERSKKKWKITNTLIFAQLSILSDCKDNNSEVDAMIKIIPNEALF
jgi:hypothetical protein